MRDSIFTKIVKGELPSHKIYETDTVLAFLDIYSNIEGHVLVIPKRQVEFVWDLDDELYGDVMRAVRKIALHMRQVLSVHYIGEKIVGTDVPHAHVHLVPFTTAAEFNAQSVSPAEPDHKKLALVAEKLRLSD